MKRGGDDAAYRLAARMRKGVVLVLCRRGGSSALGSGCFLRGGFGTAAATSSVRRCVGMWLLVELV